MGIASQTLELNLTKEIIGQYSQCKDYTALSITSDGHKAVGLFMRKNKKLLKGATHYLDPWHKTSKLTKEYRKIAEKKGCC